MKNISLADLKAFLQVAQQRSFQRAASELGVSRSALSHAMRSLESQLGVRLLHRTTRSVSLTEEGAALLQRIDPQLRSLDDALDATRFHPQDLRHHRCIAQRLPSGKRYRWEFVQNEKPFTLHVPGNLWLDNSALMVDAAVEGLGIAFVPEPFARSAIDEGLVVEVLNAFSPPIEGLCLYYSSHRQVPAALKAFIAVIRAVTFRL